ncbi:hypothetical protein WHI96_11695 [Pseudonocardia tropica]|uniref:Uncharacterized protein n=1 Tax=Pseudonocardia tropica TaxID=681289 RepID=A0ABV1JV92_9PSEU
MQRIVIVGISVLAMSFGMAPLAQAAPLPVYRSLAECNRDANTRNTTVSFPINNDYFSCKQVGWVPNGVAGCPPVQGLKDDGCIGDYYQVIENRL